MAIIAAILCVCLGIFMVVKPDSLPDIEMALFVDGGKRSKLYHVLVRIVGCALILLGAFIFYAVVWG